MRGILRLGILLVLVVSAGCGSKRQERLKVTLAQEHPFDYDLHFQAVEGKGDEALVCFHGFGGDYKIGYYVKDNIKKDITCISFNFPDYGARIDSFDPKNAKLGSLEDLLPALYVLKQVVVDAGFTKVSIYGFSAGGGAVINTLAILNSKEYDAQLKILGISPQDKTQILKAVERGYVLLDAPLKSIRELIAFHQPREDLLVVGERFAQNQLEPIDNLDKLQGLSLHFLVNFQQPDEILSNRDDQTYIDKLQRLSSSKGSVALICKGSGHSLPHPYMWDLYHSLQSY